MLSGNALLGAVTAGVIQKVRGGSFQDGFTRGAMGGATVYLGKRVAAEHFDGAGFLGRQVAAVGSSVVRNAADGRRTLERLILPAGPLRVYVAIGAEPRIRAKVDLFTLFWIGYGVVEPAREFDAQKSWSAGAPVFVAPDRNIVWRWGEHPVSGTVPAGVILLSGAEPHVAYDDPRVFAHERIHLLQYDQVLSTWVDPLEQTLLPHVPGGDFVHRYANVLTPFVIAPFFLVGEYDSRPWEGEARFFAP